jgi:hypothetical protein
LSIGWWGQLDLKEVKTQYKPNFLNAESTFLILSTAKNVYLQITSPPATKEWACKVSSDNGMSTVYSELLTKSTNAFCGQNAELMNIKLQT